MINNNNYESTGFQKSIKNNKLLNEFDISDDHPIGYGTFGVVIKAERKIDGKEYAIKMVAFRENNGPEPNMCSAILEDFPYRMRELTVWAKLNDQDFFVKHRDDWVETDDNSKKRFIDTFCCGLPDQAIYRAPGVSILYIQMDLCWMSLNTAIDQISNYFDYSSNKELPKMAYHICCVILYQMIEAVNYLHTRKPAIIHRDLKPANFLVDFKSNNRFIKLGDFGLSVLHESESQSHTSDQGTDQFMAPELRGTRRYSTKADVYSLGIIIQMLFNFDINRRESPSTDKKFKSLFDKTAQTLSGLGYKRPTCQDLLDQKTEWFLDFETVQQDIEQAIAEDNNEYEFVLKFLQVQFTREIN